MRKIPQGELIDTFALACEDPEPSDNWTLEGEDPVVYLTEDREGYNPQRQWPDKPFPQMPEPARATDPVPEPAPSIDLQKPLAMHHLIVDYCLSLGKDPCRKYQAEKVSNIVEAVEKNDKECPVCKLKLSNASRLKAHLRAQHMEQTPFHCATCDRYFGDKATLNLHMRKHDASAPTFVCSTCNKAYLVKSRLTEHEKVHLAKNKDQPCQYCGKKIKELKNLKQHEKNCDSNPNKDPRKKCPYCTKDYQQKKDLRHHVKVSHAGRLATFEQDFV